MLVNDYIPVTHCQRIILPKIGDNRGDLSFIESGNHIPFSIERIYYIYNIPDKQLRGAHAHRELKQLIISLSGSFCVQLDDGKNKHTAHLDSPSEGLLISNLVWRELYNFSENAICLVLASHKYDESDYIRNYSDFLEAAGFAS